MLSDRLESERSRLVELFPVPLLEYLWPDSEKLNEGLTRIILDKEKEDAGINTTNIGGWHSKKDLQEWGAECIDVLLSRMLIMGQEMVKRVIGCEEPELLLGWTIQAWANINRYGHFNKQHHHIRNFNLWSGVYYVDTGLNGLDHVDGARIIFADRNRVEVRGRDEFNRRYSVQPEPGLMLLFPSSLGHQVEPHGGSSNRITVAFNLKHAGFTTIKYEADKDNENKG